LGETKEQLKTSHVEKRRFNTENSTLEFVANSKPTVRGGDPYNKRIDRNPDDNIAVEKAGRTLSPHHKGGFRRETPVALRCCSSSADPDFSCLCNRAG
jgi:hypothetical protein